MGECSPHVASFFARQQTACLALTETEAKRKSYRKEQVTETGRRMEGQLHEQEEAYDRRCKRGKLGDTEIDDVTEVQIKKRHMEREQ